MAQAWLIVCKVIVVGGGVSGITSAVLISKKVPNSTVTLYDRHDKVVSDKRKIDDSSNWGDVEWYMDTQYVPGSSMRCSISCLSWVESLNVRKAPGVFDRHAELSVDPNTEWSEYYPKGAEIQQYWETVVERNGLKGSVHVRREVLAATWLKGAHQWAVEVKNLDDGTVFVDTADFFVSAQGRISIPKYPSIEGLYDVFNGDVIHTAKWPSGFDLKGKRVAVIGNGATGQQLIPNILSEVSRLDHYVRAKTWVTASFSRGLHEATADAPGGPVYSEEDQKTFREDPAAYLEHRRYFALLFQQRPGRETLGSQANNELREKIIDTMRQRLDGDEEWLQRVLPDYAPGCKRLTPAPGYLEALRHEKLDYVEQPILRVDGTGITTADGKHREVDVIITATGFELGYTTLFPVIGSDGIDLRDKWAPEGPIGYPESYLGLMAPGCPNYFTVLQVSPWSGVG